MATTNEVLRDSLVSHQIGLLRFSNGTRREAIEILNDTEAELAALIAAALDGVADRRGVDVVSTRVFRRLRNLQDRIRALRAAAFAESLTLWDRNLRELVAAEAAFLGAAVETALPVVYQTITPDLRRLRGMVGTQPLRGPGPGLRTLRQWTDRLSREDLDRIMGTIRTGLLEGASNREIARRVVGTRSLRGTDGVTQITRQAAETLTRTSAIHFANQAKREWYLANSDIISEEVYVATLDSRTTAVCRSLDGRRFAIGEGVYPPLHPNCRSLRVAVIDGRVLGQRPMKPVTERMLLDEFTTGRGLGRVGRRADLPTGTKTAFDRFARRRVRELVGRVPSAVTYEQWLRGQSVRFQNDVLGISKAKLFRTGRLSLDRFVDRNGRELTLRELAIRDRQAFLDAGLDPGDFGRAAA